MRLTLSIELWLKVIALSSESVEVGSDIAPVSVGLNLELILLLLISCTSSLSTYLSIVKGSVLVSKGSVEGQHSSVGSTDFVFLCMENVVEALLLTTESFKSLLRLVKDGLRVCDREERSLRGAARDEWPLPKPRGEGVPVTEVRSSA